MTRPISGSDSTYSNAWNFFDASDSQTEYEYDENGNVTKDLNKKISSIKYNSLNLPAKITLMDGRTIKYTYGADGSKLRVIYTMAVPSTTETHDYCGNLTYKDDNIEQMMVDGGYVTFANNNINSPAYHFYIQDHLGNNRVVVRQDGTVEQVNHYYPYGGLMAESTGWNAQRYKYNGKELDRMHGLDWYDYGARFQDAVIGRWPTMDPLCEKYYHISPYVYCAGDPVDKIDKDGNDWYQHNGTKNYYWFDKEGDVEGYTHIGGAGSVLGEYERIIDDMLKERFTNKSIYSNGFSFQIAEQDKGVLVGSRNGQWDILDEFVMGTGPEMTVFLSNHAYTQEMMSDDFVKRKQEGFNGGYIKEGRSWGVWDLFTTPSLIKQFIGSYTYYATKGKKNPPSLYNVIGDGKSRTSLLYHLPFKNYPRGKGHIYLTNTYQFYIWKSNIK